MAVTRKSNGKLPPSKRAAAHDSDSDAPETKQQARPKKRVKNFKGSQGADGDQGGNAQTIVAKPRNSKRMSGKLAMMMSMPIDVFCEIARYLGPDDLLRMSRASKKLRNLLMTKYSKPIWRAAEKAVGLPECPLDLSSPQYASFVFDLFCSHCFRTKAGKHLTPLRVRLCKTCSNQNLQKVSSWLGDEGLDMQSNEKELFSVLMLVNGLSITSSTEFTDEESVKALSISDLRNFMFYVPQVKAALVKYRSFGGTCEQREGYLDAGHEVTRQRYLSAHTLNRSLKHIKEMKSKEKQIAMESRKRNIIIKLKELGYTDADFRVSSDEEGWKWFSLTWQPRALTDRIWKIICPQLEETIRLRREKKSRIEKERRIDERRQELGQIAKKFVWSEEGKTCYIVPSELFELPTTKQFFESDETGTGIPEAQWLSIKRQMVEFSKIREREIENEGASVIVTARRKARLPAITTVSVKPAGCSREVQSEESKSGDILQHPTALFMGGPLGTYLNTFTNILEDVYFHCRCEFSSFLDGYPFLWQLSPPSHNDILYADALYSELDLPFMTMNDMVSLGKKFVCLRCDPTARKLMTWISLVNHFHNENFEFEEIEEKKKRLIDCKVLNMHDHDRTRPEPLAAYTGDIFSLRESTPNDSLAAANSFGLGKWIQSCKCGTHRSDRLLSESCPECEMLGHSSFFPCLGRLDGHRRAKHAYGQDQA